MLGEIRQMMEDMSPEDDRDFSWYRVNIFTVVSPVVSNCKWILGILESSGIQRVSVQLYEQSLGRAGRTLSGPGGRGETLSRSGGAAYMRSSAPDRTTATDCTTALQVNCQQHLLMRQLLPQDLVPLLQHLLLAKPHTSRVEASQVWPCRPYTTMKARRPGLIPFKRHSKSLMNNSTLYKGSRPLYKEPDRRTTISDAGSL